MREKIRLDAAMKMLFDVSRPLQIRLLNYIFKENTAEDDTGEIITVSSEIKKSDMTDIIADLFMRATECKHRYHIEFQIDEKGNMCVRMLEYGFEEAKRHMETDDQGHMQIYFPKQAVIYLEDKGKILDDMEVEMFIPSQKMGIQKVLYEVNVIKEWEITKEEKLSKGLFSLLPLEIFKLRQKVNKAAGAGNAEYAALAAEIRSTTLGIIDEAYELTEENEITDEDYYKISQICKYFFEYFSQNYEELKLRQEVEQVTEYIAEIGAKLGRKQGEEIGIKRGEEIGIKRGEEIGLKRGEEIGLKRGEEIGRKKSIDVMNEYLLNAGVDPALLKKAAELALMEGKGTEN